MSYPILCCEYCYAKKPSIEMTEVPRKRSENRQIWYRVLGETFANRCEARVVSHICLTHFKDICEGRRPNNAIPTPLPYCNENVMRRIVVNVVIPMLLCYNCGSAYKNEQPTDSFITTFFCHKCYQLPHFSDPFFYVHHMQMPSTFSQILVPFVQQKVNEPEDDDDDIQILES